MKTPTDLTPEEIENNKAAVADWLAGKPIEGKARPHYCPDSWDVMTGYLVFDFNKMTYRPAPKPVTRPWSKPEDVPGSVCWLRRKTGDGLIQRLIIGVQNGAVLTNGDPREVTFGFIHNYEYSTDRREWKPCEVTE